MIIKTIRIKDETGLVREVDEAIVEVNKGIAGDVHKGKDGKDLTMLDENTSKAIKTMNGLCTQRFMENITLSGDTPNLKENTEYQLGNAKIRITQTGKNCFVECPLVQAGKQCGLSKNLIFTRIVETGIIKIGDQIKY